MSRRPRRGVSRMKVGARMFAFAFLCAVAGGVMKWMHETELVVIPCALSALSLGVSMWLIGTAMPDGDFDENAPYDD